MDGLTCRIHSIPRVFRPPYLIDFLCIRIRHLDRSEDFDMVRKGRLSLRLLYERYIKGLQGSRCDKWKRITSRVVPKTTTPLKDNSQKRSLPGGKLLI